MQKLTVEELNRISIENFREAKKLPLVVVLDNIRSLHNVGSVFRTADAFRLEGIVLCGITATPPAVEIHKTALGAEDSVEWKYEEKTIDAINQLKEEGYVVLALEQVKDSKMLGEYLFDCSRKYALVLGNEVKGVQQEVVDACHDTIEIPQYGTKHSLNVSVSAGIAIWEAFSQLREKLM